MSYQFKTNKYGKILALCDGCGALLMPGVVCQVCAAHMKEQAEHERVLFGKLAIVIGYLLTCCGVWQEELTTRGIFAGIAGVLFIVAYRLLERD